MADNITSLQHQSITLADAKQNQFRNILRSLVDEELKEGGKFQRILGELEPLDYINTILKMMPYAYSKVPEEKAQPKADVMLEKTIVRKKLTAPAE